MTAPMWMTDCPTEETLAAFIDDRLDAATRRKVTEHLAECGECRELVLMASDFQAEVPVPVPVPAPEPVPFDIRRWFLPAASLAAAAVLAVFVGGPWLFGPDQDELIEASRSLNERPLAGRLAGNFPHQKLKGTSRGGSDPSDDPLLTENGKYKLTIIAANDAPFKDPRVHADALLLMAEKAVEVDEAISALKLALGKTSADKRDPIATDLAAALLARDRWGSSDMKKTAAEADKEKHDRDRLALDLSNDVWRRKRAPEAAWNRAVALGELGRTADAIRAWDDYLRLDSSSEWAKEAATNRSRLIDDSTR
jgi:tetratricopeptide (TPR) repeat protein